MQSQVLKATIERIEMERPSLWDRFLSLISLFSVSQWYKNWPKSWDKTWNRSSDSSQWYKNWPKSWDKTWNRS